MTQRTWSRYISATQITTFLECPLKYKTIYSGDVVRMPPNLYILYGSAIHHALEMNYRQKISSRIDIPVRDGIKFFTDYFAEEAHKALGFSVDEKVFRALLIQGEAMIIDYWEKIAPTIQPAFVESNFEIKLESFDIIIYGFFDVISEDGIIIDHKTCGESTAKQWTQSYVDKSNQLTMYDLAYRKMFKKEPKALRIDVLKRLKKGPEFESIITTRTNLQIFSLAQLMHRIKQFQELDLFYPNYNSCGNCDFNSTCDRLSIS